MEGATKSYLHTPDLPSFVAYRMYLINNDLPIYMCR